jgi:phenylacetate-CoA ligase
MNRLMSGLVRLTFYPLLQKRWHPSSYRYLREFRENEFLSPESIRNVQLARIKRLLWHATTRVPYYRNLVRVQGIDPSQVCSFGDLARFPVLTKADVREQAKDLLASDADSRRLRLNASGGSTGNPLQFYQDSEYWDYACASQWFIHGWWGIRPGDTTAFIWGNDRDLPAMGWKEMLSARICQEKICNAFALSEERMERFARELHSWQPRFVAGYASALHLFARFILERPSLRIRPHAVKSAAEVLPDNERVLIEKAFECPVYDLYGSREVNNLAAECPAHMGLHVNVLTRYIELVDDAGRPVRAGVPGRVLITDLVNYSMPFIRYENEDVACWSTAPCRCGRPFPLLAKVLGRKSDFIVTPGGKFIHGEFFTHLFYDMPQVIKFQLVQESLTDVRLCVILQPEADSSILEPLRERLGTALGGGVRCRIERVREIEPLPSGKHRFTVSRVGVPLEEESAQANGPSGGLAT